MSVHRAIVDEAATQAHQVVSSNPRFQFAWEATSSSMGWDAFVESSPTGHHEQTAAWGRVRVRYGWEVLRLVVREGSRIVGGTQLMIRPAGRLGRFGYVTYGPIFDYQNSDLSTLVIRELQAWAKSSGIVCLTLGLPYDAQQLPPHLTRAGFWRKPDRIPPNFLAATRLIDLTRSQDEIFGRMRPSTRRNIRLGSRRGVRVVEGTANDVSTFRRLMVSLCERRHTMPNPPQPDFFNQLWEVFHPKGWIKLFLAVQGDEAVSAALAFPFGEYMRVWKVGWSGQFGHHRPNEAVWWNAIQWAHRNSFRYFDFVGIDADDARAGVTSTDAAQRPMNASIFKLGFGGDIKLLPGAYCYVPNTVARTALRCGLLRLITTPVLVNVATSFLRQSYGVRRT